ncbi:hypothetical protein RBH29_01785 [Herbivorax sp. ANBcel31]|uniref:hypothetical protein n=1 Tax=Herbivorax sp. ANBcel31 TaxID=3069754 RepID=UPI0027B78901|nr:hypothetical protein [Herbivorax sp. ANBcel31]MDQ2085166.1 hypothetical protein [Herbivorax sp. ANBcel31]
MEDKIMNALDNFDIEDVDKLLKDSNIGFDIDKKTKAKINSMAYKKTGINNKRFFYRKLLASAAIILIILTSLFTVGLDNIVGALGKYFAFIPNYGIIENNNTILYVIDQQNLKTENDSYTMLINNALATEDTVSISLRIEKKDFDEEKLMKKKQEEWDRLVKTNQMKELNLFLMAGDKKYTPSNWLSGGGGISKNIYANFELNPEDINTETVYKIKYIDSNLSSRFRFENYKSFDSLEQIGSTGYNNNISITAVANRNEDILEVDLYPINKSEYDIYSFNKKDGDGYMNMDLHLMTSTGKKEYRTPDGYMNLNNKFYFDVSCDEKDFVLNIPYIMVKNHESKRTSLKIPNEGEKIAVNKEIKFKDSIVKITEVEKVTVEGNEHGALKIYFEYENKNENKIIRSFHINRVNLLGIPQGGGYSWDTDEKGIIKYVCYNLEEGEDRVLRINIENPVYYLLGEYNLELEVD